MAVDRLQKNGIFYYNRRIPDDVSAQYASKRIVVRLKTRSRWAALKPAACTRSVKRQTKTALIWATHK
jgi:hypothetical protein